MNANKRVINKIFLVIAAAVFFATPAAATFEGDIAPAWTATTFQGETYSFPDMVEEKPTVIIFWASWCSYCKAFMPYLKKIEQEYGTDFIQIVAINMKEEQEGESDPGAYIENTGIELTAIKDGDEIAAAYNVRFVPGLMVIGDDGTVLYRRGMSKLPAGQEIAELWYEKVRAVLDQEFEDILAGC
jgi:thiol-disulfide isomerase/thioredoxin